MSRRGNGWYRDTEEHREAALKGKRGHPRAAAPGEARTAEDMTIKEIRMGHDGHADVKVEKAGRVYDVRIKELSPEEAHRLDRKQRNSLPTRYFAGPDRTFPVEDRGHVRSAYGHLKRSHYSPAEKREIRKNIDRRAEDLRMR